MKITPDVLRPHPLLALLPCKTLKHLVAGSAVSEHPKGTVLFHQGDPCEAIYLIISGRCEARVPGRNGGEVVEEVFGPGDSLGERAFLNNEPYHFSAVVATHCVLLRIPAEELEGLFTKDPRIAGRFSQTVTKRLHVLRSHMAGKVPDVRRVVSLLALAPRLDAGRVMQRLAASLFRITRRSVLVVQLVRDDSGPRPHAWVNHQFRLDGSFSYERDVRSNDAGFDELRLPVGIDSQYIEAIAPVISHCGGHYDYVLLHVAPELPDRAIIECTIQADIAYVLLQPGMSSAYDFDLLVRAVSDHAPGSAGHLKPIVFVEEPVAVEEFHAMFQHLGHTVHSFAHGFPLSAAPSWPDRRFDLHINRLAREIGRCRVGIAFSSGGAKGLSHVGIIQVLEENGIEVDAIAGASMGAYVGANWAYGLDGSHLEKLAMDCEGRWGLLSLMDPVIPPRRGFMRTRRIARRLRRALGKVHFSDLVRPLRIVATQLDTLERVVFSTGEVVPPIEASIAIPGICVPVCIDGETYVDGGVVDPLPVDVLEEMGIERIIAVNAIPTPERLRYWLESEKEKRASEKSRWSPGRWLNEHVNYFARGNVFDTMVQAFVGAQMLVAETATRRADVVLRPVCCDAWWCDFTRPRKYIALGRSVAEAQLPELLALVNQAPDEHPPLPHKPVAVPPALRAA